jgi:Na+/proline symporter/signal transduction histidine kinase
MINWIFIGASFAYLALLFLIAYLSESKSVKKKSLTGNPYVYALSLTVYCTAWTYYGSVGRAAESGMEFLTTYIGPTLTVPLWGIVLQKIIRISKTQHLTSIADFISSRYGKSSLLGVLVTLFCLLEGFPYIALQLKSIANSLYLTYPLEARVHARFADVFSDTTFYIVIGLTFFTLLFGTRKVEATEQHEGMVGAIAFEALIKLFAFLAAGVFVTWIIFKGPDDLFERAWQQPHLRQLFVLPEQSGYANWFWASFLSAFAVLLLPRQFQVAVVENVKEKHLKTAIWFFPFYLLVINLFVMPIALGGKLLFDLSVDADTYVLAIPLLKGQYGLALLVYIGGFSAASGMVIVSTIALSTMVSNNLVMPMVLHYPWLKTRFSEKLVQVLLFSRRLAIVLILLGAYLYYKGIAEYYPLVSIGLVAFAAVAQFAPAVIGGLFWREGSKTGAIVGISLGFATWAYTLVLPSVVGAGFLPVSLMEEGPWGISWLRPFALFNLDTFDYISHAMFWSMLFNTTAYIGFSLFGKQTLLEKQQATLFVDIFKKGTTSPGPNKVSAPLLDLRSLLVQFLGEERTKEALAVSGQPNNQSAKADLNLIAYSERLLAGAIGAASARIMVSSVTREEEIGIGEVVGILKESQQLIELNRQLQQQSQELEKASLDLTQANLRLKELDRLKDEFLSTVTHELRTPVTSIRALSEILYDNPELEPEERSQFLGTIIKETERMTRLIAQVLDLEKYESGKQVLQPEWIQPDELLRESTEAIGQLLREKNIELRLDMETELPLVYGDKDRLMQVLLNLLSNAIKFCDPEKGLIGTGIRGEEKGIKFWVEDNGKGIDPEEQDLIFNKFYQTRNQNRKKPAGSGLGLAISQKIVELHKGSIWVDSIQGEGARFSFFLPLEANPYFSTPQQ